MANIKITRTNRRTEVTVTEQEAEVFKTDKKE